MGWMKLRDINFLSLSTAIFCVECELISENNTPQCIACSSQAVLSLSRVLGGSLRGQPSARVIDNSELDRMVRDLLLTVPSPAAQTEIQAVEMPIGAIRQSPRMPEKSSPMDDRQLELHFDEAQLQPGISAITERAQVLTGATGAAIALRRGQEVVCRARAGRTAPDLGVLLTTEAGISADCIRTGEVMLCHDTENNPRVDLSICRRLGVRSILAAPLRHYRRTLGIFEVLSSAPNAFDGRDVATMQLLSGITVAAMTRPSNRSEEKRSA